MEKKERGGCQDFPPKVFCLTVPNISVGEAFSVAIDSGVEKFWIRVGGGGRGYQDFPSIFLSHSAENVRRGILLCRVSEKLPLRKSLWIRGGVSRLSIEIFLSHRAEKFHRWGGGIL